MKDDISTPTPEGLSPNAFESDKPGTNARSNAEAAIEELRQRGGIFVDAVRATRMPMALTDPNLPGNPIVFANASFLKLSGYQMDEVLGQQPHFMNGPATDLRDAARFAEVLGSGQDDIIETVQYRKDGTPFVATVLISAFKDESGHTLNHFMSWLDVTRRVDAEGEVADLKAVQASLRESDARHRLLIDSWAQAVWETDADGLVVKDSPSWRAYTGQTGEEMLGYGWLDAIHPEDRAYAERQWRGAVATQGNVNVEFRIRAPDGTWRWTNVRAAPVLDDQGKVEKWAGMNIDIDDRKGAETALRVSEEKHRSLFDSIDEGFCLVEVLFDDAGKARDYRFIEVNSAFERQTGLVDAVGKTMRSLAPGHEEGWFETYGRVARTGEPERFELEAAALGRWYDVYSFRSGEPGKNQVAILFRDVRSRKRAEAALRESEERQAFLLQLSDALRPLTDAAEIQRTTTRMVGEHLQVDRVMFAEVEGDRGAETGTMRGQFTSPSAVPFPEHFTFNQFGAHTMPARYRGKSLVVADVETDKAFSTEERQAWLRNGVRAAAVAALAKGGQLVAEFGVHSTAPRKWTDAEVLLIEEVAQRTWDAAERARAEAALRESEERYRSLFGSMDEAYAVVEVLKDGGGNWCDFRFVEVNPAFIKHTAVPAPVGKTATELLGTPNPRWTELYGQALDTGQPLRTEESEPALDLTFDLNIFTLDRARNRVAVLFTNITERKTAEKALKDSERHAQVLLGELQHRVRNTLAVVHSIARRTAELTDGSADFMSHFDGRLNAFSRVQAGVTRSASGSVELKTLVEDELLALATREGEHLKIHGPKTCLKARAAESMSLAIHELATNAVKYGALSAPDGKVQVTWECVTDGAGQALKFEWRERGVEISPDPKREGFGHELLLRSLPYDLGAKTDIVFEDHGLLFTMLLPLGPDVNAAEA